MQNYKKDKIKGEKNMKVLKFNLSGDFAFFKNEVMNDIYDTYPHIHKPALLGLFGAMLGYDGYAQTQKVFGNEDNSYPEYYQKLKDLKVAIVPKKQSFTKVLETFTNTTAMFNRVTVMDKKEKDETEDKSNDEVKKVKGKKSDKKVGATLIVEQFWLEKPSWDIYLIVDNEESKKIEDSILNFKTVYSLYLGANNHFANISDIGLLESKEITENAFIINSLIKADEIKANLESMLTSRKECKNLFYFNYILPTKLSPNNNIYQKEGFVLTNDLVGLRKNKAYNVNGVNVVFY
jgi:CRISPR-associated protein Cas5, Hmari subtype